MIKELETVAGFQWDMGNINKNLIRHKVENWECEQIFFNNPLLLLEDPGHSNTEKRWAAFGKTEANRLLVVIFTIRDDLIRVISARDMDKKERIFIMKKLKTIPKFKNEDEEREFWATQSPLDYFLSEDFKKASFPRLKPSLKSISIRLPEGMLAELKILANKKDVPYQSLAKIYLARQISLEQGSYFYSQKKRKATTGESHETKTI